MKKLLILLLLVPLILPLSSCKKVKGKGDVVTETRNITGFTGISLAVESQLRFIPDTIFRVELTAQENVLEVIESYVDGGVLVIKLEHNTVLGKHDEIQILVHAPGVNLLDISGSGNITQTGNWISQSIRTSISGSGNLVMGYIEADEFSIYISGSGSASAAGGAAGTVTLNISGSGGMDVLGVTADTVYANISGSGSMQLTAGKLLDATISGSGNILYDGNPVVTTHISGSGTVRHI